MNTKKASAVWVGYSAALALIVCLWGSMAWAVVPTLEKVAPGELVSGSEGVSIAVQGTGFDVSAVVMWGAVSLSTTLYGTTGAVALVPNAVIAEPGMGIITVVNNDGASNSIGLPVTESVAKQFEPVLYIAAGLMGAMAFIWGFGTKW